MSRLNICETRKINTIEPYLGKVIVFCEGQTEEAYIQYFINKFENKRYFDVTVKNILIGGNSKAVYKHAKSFLANPSNNLRYGLDFKKYLIFDCDAPDNIEEVIKEIENNKQFDMLLTNSIFEVWLLMHFEKVVTSLSYNTIYARLKDYIGNYYNKGSYDDIRLIIEEGSVDLAIKNSKELEEKYQKQNKAIPQDIKQMNPYSNVYQLIEQFVKRMRN